MTDQTTDKPLTPRQFDALEGVLEGHGPRAKKYPPNHWSGAKWSSARSCGGSVRRMVEDLQTRGFLSRSTMDLLEDIMTRAEARAFYDKVPTELRDPGNRLTLKALRALEGRFAKKKFDPTDGTRAKIRETIPAREKLEAEIEAFIVLARNTERDRYQRVRAAKDKARVETVRALLVNNFSVDGRAWSDGAILAFAKAVEGAQYSDNYVRHMDLDDLSAELDAAEKETHAPGTSGADQRSKTVQLIRAEFERRAKEAA